MNPGFPFHGRVLTDTKEERERKREREKEREREMGEKEVSTARKRERELYFMTRVVYSVHKNLSPGQYRLQINF
jgi:hypothetical protein